jgi:hypothetical protein
VGNGNSSNDIAAHLAPHVRAPIYRSIRHPPLPRFPCLPDSRIIDVAPVVRYTNTNTEGKPTLTVTLMDGTEIPNVDTVFFGTGYASGVSFLRVLSPVPATDTNTGPTRTLTPLTSPTIFPSRIPSLYHHILYAPNPSLAFIGALVCFTPFTMADLCSTFLALAWTGVLPYPRTIAERLVEETERMEVVNRLRRMDNPSAFLACHVLADGEQPWAQGVREEVVRAKPEFDGVLAEWTVEKLAERELMYPRKLECLKFAQAQGDENQTCL